MIAILNPQFSIRNEKNSSYIVKKSWRIDPNIENDIALATIIPPAIGYILKTIGQDEYEKSLSYLSDNLGISKDVIRKFTTALIENEEKKSLFIGNERIIFPRRLLIKSDTPEDYEEIKPNASCNLLHLRPQIPINLNFMITTKCTTNCCYCYAKRNLKKELQTDEIIRFIKECKDYGVINLSLTGGDIFAHKDWKLILATTIKCGYNPFLSTKTPLGKEDIEFLHQIGIKELQFSLDSSCPETLNQLVHVNNSYLPKVNNMFMYCEQSGIKLGIRTVLCETNSQVTQIKELHGFLSKFANIKDWVMTPAFFSEFKQEEYKKYEVPNENLIQVNSYIEATAKSFPIYLNKISECGYELKRERTVNDYVTKNQICYANSFSMSVLASGECTICEMLYENEEYTIGNIKDQSLFDIWNSPKALSLFTPNQNEISTVSPCHTCKVFDECKKNIAKRVCYADIAKTNGGATKDLPDPRCPLSRPINVIL
ncbi:MAG: radical SAM protein [Bacteroidaceae bacterium]|nr:radical SAM protein [Bacteroidaceae bacterium]